MSRSRESRRFRGRESARKSAHLAAHTSVIQRRLLIAADTHEWISGVPGKLKLLGVEVARVPLATGDYDLGSDVLVERKRVRDLHLTLVSGRYWRQIGTLRRCAGWPFLLVEGADLAVGPVGLEAIRGVFIATLEQGVSIIRSNDGTDSAAWLRRLAARVQGGRHRYRPRFAQLPKSPPDATAVAMLSSIPGISAVTAQALLERFGTIAALVAAEESAWLGVRGMGSRRRDALGAALHGAGGQN